tara:strand:- start:1039 stop:1830 length:792 start_codon:yes stop_codon:yes gene_type:complete
MILSKLAKIRILKRMISSIGIRVLRIFKKNRGYFKIKNINMFLDFLDPIDRELIINQEYEKKEITILTKLIKNHDIGYFLDIGANCGAYSFNIASQFENLNILAFEPNKEAYEKFNKTLEINLKRFKNIKIFNFGLSDKKSKLKMRSQIKHGYAQTGGSTVTDEKNYENAKVYDANFEIGNEILKLTNSNIAIKIDVEGHEINVLLGLKQILTNNNCVLQIEIFDKNYEKSNKFLLENNFKKISENKPYKSNNYENYFYSNIK